jgi:hypothetical protein
MVLLTYSGAFQLVNKFSSDWPLITDITTPYTQLMHLRCCIESRLCITLMSRNAKSNIEVDQSMDWTNRGNSQNQAAQPAAGGAPTSHRANKTKNVLGGLRFATVALLFSATALVVALIYFLAVGGGKSTESGYIDKDKMQAVFLNGGQVYFGKIRSLDGKFMRVNDIYYLRVNQQVQPNQQNGQTPQAVNDISLVKLGCELHGPVDEMLINREQVIFWENLKDDGQVAKAVAEYVKANPDGQKCETTTNQSTQPTTQTQTQTTPTTNTNTTNNTNRTTTPTTPAR